MSTVMFDVPKETLLALKVSEAEIGETLPIQYLHQLELLHILPLLTKRVIIPKLSLFFANDRSHSRP